MKLKLAVFSAALCASAFTYAQYTGETTYQSTAKAAASAPKNIAEILKAPVDDQMVTLTGKITKKIGDEKYMFTDGSGEIQLDIDDDDIATVKVDNNTKITIVGEVEIEDAQLVEIDVESIKLD